MVQLLKHIKKISNSVEDYKIRKVQFMIYRGSQGNYTSQKGDNEGDLEGGGRKKFSVGEKSKYSYVNRSDSRSPTYRYKRGSTGESLRRRKKYLQNYSKGRFWLRRVVVIYKVLVM